MKRMILNIKDKEKVASMYESGMSLVQIGEVFGVSQSTIYTFMKRHNIETRAAHKPEINLDKERVVDLYNSGMTLAQVGKDLGVSHSLIFEFMKKHNIKTRTKEKTIEKREQGRQMKQLRNLEPVKTRELISEAKSVDINYTTQFKKKYTQISDELNLYIPEKWNRNKIW